MNKKEKLFIETVWDYYGHNGRRSLPWRMTKNAYRILVSEVMLQQTQVERVVPKYKEFLKQFPTVDVLAESSLGDVLRAWQGLGYNRRAKMLHECVKIIVRKFRSLTPKSHEDLMLLPGIGPYTAGAVLSFAYNIPIPMIETNIRSVYLHHFFKGKENVTDKEIFPLIKRTLDHENPREWYYALMDYGAYLKKEFGNPNTKSKHHTKQTSFRGSNREVRGAIVRILIHSHLSLEDLRKTLKCTDEKIATQVQALEKEGIIKKRKTQYYIP